MTNDKAGSTATSCDHVPASREVEIHQELAGVGVRTIEYPWQEIRTGLKSSGAGVFRLLGYGSLLDASSAKHNVESGSRTLAIAFGIRRVFDYHMPEYYRNAWGIQSDSRSTAALNVALTRQLGDTVNGVVIEVSYDEIDGMLKREQGYDLCSVPYLPWGNLSAEVQSAYVLSASWDSMSGRRFLRKDILPCDGYLDLCCRGARSYGEEFYDSFLDTTYLADGITSIRHIVEQEDGS